MKLCDIRGTAVRCDPALGLLGAYYLWNGQGGALLWALCALFLHETAHALAAAALGYRVACVEVQPLGCVARLADPIDRWDELCVAAAGPLFSLLCAMGCALAQDVGVQSETVRDFQGMNLALACVNLLPAFPLDGGRVLRALLGGKERLCIGLGIGLGGALCALGAALFWKGQPTLLFLGVLLLLSALRERGILRGAALRGMLAGERRLRRGRALGVAHVALHADTRAGEALRRAAGGRYTLWYVVRDDLRCTPLDEGALLAGIARWGADAPLRALVDPAPRK